MRYKPKNIPTANFFEAGRASPRAFPLQVPRLEIGDAAQENVPLEVSYDQHFDLSFRNHKTTDLGQYLNATKGIYLRGANFPDGGELFLTRMRESVGKGTEIIMVPKRSLLLIRLGADAVRVEAVVINGPEFFFDGWEPEFIRGGFRLALKDFPTTHDLRTSSRLHRKDSIATGTVVLTRLDGNSIEPEEALQAIAHLFRFFSFVRGAYCGFGHINGFDSEGTMAFSYLGFTKHDQFNCTTGWYDIAQVKSLPELYDLYSTAVAKIEDTFPILRAIEFYRASNILRETSLEMAVVASHSALETIAPHVLSTRSGMSKDEIEKLKGFHAKTRAVAKFVNITCDPLQNLSALQNRKSAENGIDAYQLLGKFRNAIVHQSEKFPYTCNELDEVWNFSQWLCEVLIFYFLRYRGKMKDRRGHQGGARGSQLFLYRSLPRLFTRKLHRPKPLRARPLPSPFEPLVLRPLQQFPLLERWVEVHKGHDLRLAGAFVEVEAAELAGVLQPRAADDFGERH